MRAWRIIKSIFLPVSLAASWLGILFVPQNISDLPTALGAWSPVMEWVTRESLLIAYSFGLTLYVCLRDAAPRITDWWLDKASPIKIIEKSLHSLSISVINDTLKNTGSAFHEYTMLRIFNHSRTGETLRNVQASAFFMGKKHKCYTLDGETRVDLRHGDIVDFSIGSFFTSDVRNFSGSRETMDDESFAGVVHNLKLEHKSYMLPSAPGKHGTGLHLSSGTEMDWPYSVVISADGVRARIVELLVRLDEDGKVEVSIKSIGPFRG